MSIIQTGDFQKKTDFRCHGICKLTGHWLIHKDVQCKEDRYQSLHKADDLTHWPYLKV